MSTESVQQAIKPKSEPLFSKKNRKLLSNPLDADNPITVQILGICSALAVTVQMKPALFMAVGVTIIVGLSSFIIAIIRNMIPNRVRIIVQLMVAATLVVIIDQLFQAYAYDISKQLSVYISLILTNCILLGRIEAFAMGNKPWPSLLDGIGNGAGYGAILMITAVIRELLGSGSLFGYKLLGDSYIGNGVMILPAGACFVIGLVVWMQRARNGYRED
ncbi:MAG: NADH:ubiquinone reductase (Na(+)-transporting) subunit D [Bacteroidetes bacterium]|nr:NADH:ubiquinone reductase (Na(+)-transporting) subunit D [Bacteroidota bacterium]